MTTRSIKTMTNAGIFALAEIKAAIEAFERGDTYAFDALDAILVAIEAYQAATRKRRDAA